MTVGCIYAPDSKAWTLLARSNLGGVAVKLSVRATPETGGKVGNSATIGMSFAQDDLLGGLYYWTTSPNPAMWHMYQKWLLSRRLSHSTRL